MKKVALVLVALLCIAGVGFAADKKADSGLSPYFDKNTLAANVGIGWGGIAGGVDYEFARFDIAKVVPVVIGASVRAAVDPGLFLSYTDFGVSGYANAHVELTGLNVPEWLKNFDVYFGLGGGIGSATASWASLGFGFQSFEGITYFFNKNLGVTFENGTAGTYRDKDYSSFLLGYYNVYYSTIGITYKF